MRSIWKYTLDPGREVQRIEMPHGAVPLSAREQGENVCMWAEVDPSAHHVARYFETVGTGWETPDRRRRFIGTAQLPSGLVFHVFEVGQ